MTALLIGYARCSTDAHDLTAQREGLTRLGVTAERIYVDHGLTGTKRERAGLREALAACRAGDTPVVTSSTGSPGPAGRAGDRRRVDHPAGQREHRGIGLRPPDAVGRLLFNVLAMVVEFESDLIRLRTCVGCA